MGLSDKIKVARDAGYSDDEIRDYLKPKVDQASSAGYSPQEIRDHLISAEGVDKDFAFNLTATTGERIGRAVAPAVGAITRPLKAAQDAITGVVARPGEAFDAISRRAGLGAQAEIPFLAEGGRKVEEMAQEGLKNAGEVAETLARAGYPRIGQAAGIAAGAFPVAQEALLPIPKTVGSATELAAMAAAPEFAKGVGMAVPGLRAPLGMARADIASAAQGVSPALNTDIGGAVARRLGIRGTSNKYIKMLDPATFEVPQALGGAVPAPAPPAPAARAPQLPTAIAPQDVRLEAPTPGQLEVPAVGDLQRAAYDRLQPVPGAVESPTALSIERKRLSDDLNRQAQLLKNFKLRFQGKQIPEGAARELDLKRVGMAETQAKIAEIDQKLSGGTEAPPAPSASSPIERRLGLESEVPAGLPREPAVFQEQRPSIPPPPLTPPPEPRLPGGVDEMPRPVPEQAGRGQPQEGLPVPVSAGKEYLGDGPAASLHRIAGQWRKYKRVPQSLDEIMADEDYKGKTVAQMVEINTNQVKSLTGVIFRMMEQGKTPEQTLFTREALARAVDRLYFAGKRPNALGAEQIQYATGAKKPPTVAEYGASQEGPAAILPYDETPLGMLTHPKSGGINSKLVASLTRLKDSPEVGDLRRMIDSKRFNTLIRKDAPTLDAYALRAFNNGSISEPTISAYLEAVRDQLFKEAEARRGPKPRGQGGFFNLGGQAPAPNDPSPVAAFKSHINKFKEELPSWRATFEKLFTQAVDQNNPIKEFFKKRSVDPTPNDNVLFAIDRYQKTGKLAMVRLEHGTFIIDGNGNVVKTGEALSPILKNLDDMFAKQFGADNVKSDLDALMLAQRDFDLAQRTAAPYASGNVTEAIHGVDPENAPAVIAHMRQKYGNDIFAIADRVRAWQRRAFLDPLVEAGVLTAERAAAMEKFYIPYDRVIEDLDAEGAARFASGNPLKKLTGSEKNVYSGLDRMIGQTFRVAEFAERNKVFKSAVSMRNDPAFAGEIKEVPESGRGTVTVYIDGNKRFFEIPSEIKETLENLSPKGLGFVVDIASIPAALQRTGITADPQFSVARNIPRDAFSAAIQAKYGFNPANFAQAIFHALKNDDAFFDFEAGGGSGSALVGIDRMDAAQVMDRLRGLKELDGLSPLSLLQKLSEMSEMGTRAGVHGKAKAAGASSLEAAYEASEATTNFAIKPGSDAIRAFGSITAFFRPSILSAARFFRAMHENPVRTTMRGTTYLTLPSIALWYANKDNPEYKEWPLWMKNTYWAVPNGKGRLIPVVKPFEYGAIFASLPERILDHIYKNDPRAIESAMHRILDAFTPPLVPTPLAPILDANANFNPYTGRNIVPKSKERLLPQDQYGEFTSETAKLAGQKLGYPPAKIDYLVGGYGGTIGRRMMSLGDMALNSQRPNKIPKAEAPFQDLVLARRAVGSNSESVSRFYEIKDQLEREFASAQAADPYNEPDVNPLLEQMRETEHFIKEYRAQREQINRNPRMVPESKKMALDRIDATITKLAASMVSVMEKRGR